jgi:hypothetical protein
MFQVVTSDLLKELKIKLPEFEGATIPENAIFVGNFGGLESNQIFYSRSWAGQPSPDFKSTGGFVGQVILESRRQVTEKLYAFALSTYAKGWGEYNRRVINCTTFGKTAEMIAGLTSRDQVICVVGELRADTYTSKKTQEEITQLALFASSMNFCGEKVKQSNATNSTQSNYSSQKTYTPAAQLDEIPFELI